MQLDERAIEQEAPATSERPRILLALAGSDEGRLCARLLRAQDLHVDGVGNGIDALVKALSHRFDVIVASGDLPGISGEDLCHVLRRDPWTREVPLILATAEPVSPSTRRAVDLLIAAPFDAARLPESVAHLLRGRSVRAASPEPTVVGPANRRHQRGQTMSPPLLPPRLACPRCERTLSYLHSQLGGINERSSEQWDYFECPNACGTFQYRHRTRRLRAVLDRSRSPVGAW